MTTASNEMRLAQGRFETRPRRFAPTGNGCPSRGRRQPALTGHAAPRVACGTSAAACLTHLNSDDTGIWHRIGNLLRMGAIAIFLAALLKGSGVLVQGGSMLLVFHYYLTR